MATNHLVEIVNNIFLVDFFVFFFHWSWQVRNAFFYLILYSFGHRIKGCISSSDFERSGNNYTRVNSVKVHSIEKGDNTDVFEVPQDSFFVMGDNRDRSDDSRISVSFVPKENLVGKARFIFFSHNDKGEIYEPWTWFRAIRWNRFFMGIY